MAASTSPTAYAWGAGVQQIGLGGLLAAFSTLALVSLAAAGVAPSSGLFARVRNS
jgi:hypothetical protein